MKRNSIFLVSSTHKTKTWWTFVSVLVLVFVPFLIVWLLTCEFNLIDTNWLVAKNASVWHGYVTNENIETLVNKYAIFHEGGASGLHSALLNYLGKDTQGSIVAFKTFFDPVVLAPLFGLLAWSIAYPIIFNATKVSGLDVLPFSVTIGMSMFSLILTGLIPHWGQNLDVVYWIVRIVIAAAVAFVSFIICNFFVNKFLATRSYASDIYFGYKVANDETKESRQLLKENVDIFKHNKDKDPTYVEIEQEEK